MQQKIEQQVGLTMKSFSTTYLDFADGFVLLSNESEKCSSTFFRGIRKQNKLKNSAYLHVSLPCGTNNKSNIKVCGDASGFLFHTIPQGGSVVSTARKYEYIFYFYLTK